MAGPSTSTPPASSLNPEERAREFLAQRQWRRARDEIKPLYKKDRARFLPLLVKANIGLSQEMIAKGQVSEAQQVLAYLATIATPDQMRMAERELTGQAEVLRESVASLAEKLSGVSNLGEPERLRLADRLVLASSTAEPGSAIDSRLAAELKAVHDGLLAASMQQWDRVGDILRAVPHRSLFAHWVAFIKGMVAFYSGGTEKAARFLEQLPSGSVPWVASRSYLLWLKRPEPRAGKEVSESDLEGACRILGHRGLGAALLKANGLWKRDQHWESYRAVREGVPGFPARSVDVLGTLSDFYFKQMHLVDGESRIEYIDRFEELVMWDKAKSGVEEWLALRLLAVRTADRELWERLLQIYEGMHGPNPRLAAMVYCDIGKRLAEPSPAFYGFVRSRPELMDGPGSVACLKKAVALDPNNLEAHLLLVKVYTILRRRQERNRLLDEMVKRFPDEKQVLIDASVRCLERSAFTKALDYARRARELDQIDPRVSDLMVLVRLKLAEQNYKQQRIDKAREGQAALEPFLTDRPDDFKRSRWVVQWQFSTFEQAWGDPAEAERLAEAARKASPFPAAYVLFKYLSLRPIERDGVTNPIWPEAKSVLQGSLELAQIVFLLRIIDHWRPASMPSQITAADQLVGARVQAAAAHGFSRVAVQELLELRAGSPAWTKDLLKLVAKVLASDPADPLFRFYKFELEHPLPAARDLDTLKEIEQEAARRGDERTRQRVHHLIARLQAPPPPPDFFDEDDEDDEDDDLDDILFGPDDEDEDSLDAGPGPIPEALLNSLPPEAAEELAVLMGALAQMSDAQIEEAKRTRPKNMPAELLDLMIQAARKGGPLPPPKKPKGPGGKGRWF